MAVESCADLHLDAGGHVEFIAGKDNLVADDLSRLPGPIDSLEPMVSISWDEVAAAQRQDPDMPLIRQAITGLRFADVPLLDGNSIMCDVSTSRPQPVLPRSFRRRAFDVLHDICHPGIKTSIRLVLDRFVWHGARSDIRDWAKGCTSCQQSKVTTHVKLPWQAFPPATRFHHLHVDVMGPLHQSEGNHSALIMVDRNTKWVEAVPTNDTTAPSLAVWCNHSTDKLSA